jgi:hypothetical protein
MIITIGYRTYIETLDHAKRFEIAAHPQCELALAIDRWRFLQNCADAEGCWVVFERVDVHCEETDFRIVKTDLTRATCLDPTQKPSLTCIAGGKKAKKRGKRK